MCLVRLILRSLRSRDRDLAIAIAIGPDLAIGVLAPPPWADPVFACYTQGSVQPGLLFSMFFAVGSPCICSYFLHCRAVETAKVAETSFKKYPPAPGSKMQYVSFLRIAKSYIFVVGSCFFFFQIIFIHYWSLDSTIRFDHFRWRVGLLARSWNLNSTILAL